MGHSAYAWFVGPCRGQDIQFQAFDVGFAFFALGAGVRFRDVACRMYRKDGGVKECWVHAVFLRSWQGSRHQLR